MPTTRIATWAACLVCLLSPALARGGPCGFGVAPSYHDEFSNSDLVLFGRLANAPQAAGAKKDAQGTDLVITHILKGHAALAGKKRIRLPSSVVIKDPKNPPHLLIFVDVFKGKLDVYRAVAATPAFAGYFKGLIAIDARDRVGVMRYCFRYLAHKDPVIAADAQSQFENSPDGAIAVAARHLSAVELRRWLQDRRAPEHRRQLCVRLLGLCGDSRDAALVRRHIDRLLAQSSAPYLQHYLTAYTLLDPKAGWAFTRQIAATPSAEFLLRYAALNTARDCYTIHPGVIPENEILDVVAQAVSQSDIADIAIERLRQWRCWALTHQVLPLFKKKTFAVPIIRCSIVHYALECPDAAASRFIKQLRQSDPSLVADIEELLKLEKGQ